MFPDTGAEWSTVAQAFWVDFSGLPGALKKHASDDSSEASNNSALEALEQIFGLGLRWNFAVDNYGIITCSSPGKVFMLEASPGCLGVVKKAFDRWRDILETGARLVGQYECESGPTHCPPLRSFLYQGVFDKAGGLSLANRLLEATKALLTGT